MSDLTIKQTQFVLGWSYPTAFGFAKRTGMRIEGKWFIPYTVVAGKVQERVVEASKAQARLLTVSNGNN